VSLLSVPSLVPPAIYQGSLAWLKGSPSPSSRLACLAPPFRLSATAARPRPAASFSGYDDVYTGQAGTGQRPRPTLAAARLLERAVKRDNSGLISFSSLERFMLLYCYFSIVGFE
jgi:hypothetical protein